VWFNAAQDSGAIEVLSQESDILLRRIRRRSPDADPGSLTTVLAASEQSAPGGLKRLAREYELADYLDPSWALRPLELVREDGETVLLLEDLGGDLLSQHLGVPMGVERFLRLAIGITSAVSKMHQGGLIHKDIKPANILVDSSDGTIRLTGFGIASRVPRERQSPDPPEFIAGTLAYMAPEQTGRMNRSIDSRSDLYSLGVTFYEMLTGTLPFTASDPMEWMHCHIARQADAPHERVSGIPEMLSSIVIKLLAKTAEERYQTVLGVEADLRRCLNEWRSHGRIDPFRLAARDVSDRLLIAEELYGREREIAILLASFDRVVSRGRPELVLVSGYAGIGKSSVVNELHRSLVPPRGFFASGKFDQYKRDIPYATLAQAFQRLIHPILVKNEEELGRWRVALREALGPNGQLMVDLIPELKLIIGEQQPVPELPSLDAQRRFQLVFRRFIGAFTQEHPLALFLDDLQWLDAATLDLMEDLLTHPVKDLMLIGAYRDNEVTPAHPLMRKLQAMRQAGAIVHEIVLAPLSRADLEQLIADSLHCERGRAEPLAELIEDKTTGNPFFAIQFVSALVEESLLTFDYGEGEWRWDLNRIHAKGYTDNVVDLMVGKLNRLPNETQKALEQLACLGNSVDFATLRTVYQDSSEAMHGQLWEAVRTGLIFRSEDSYRFLHDRVQEAAYSQIPPELRAEAHLRIGMLMVSSTSPDKLEEGIFEIVNQLNRGAHLITSIGEQDRIAELNLIAGRRAKISTAYAAAIKYVLAGRRWLTEETWSRNYDLVFSIEVLLAECELLTADMSAAEDRLSKLAGRARNAHDIALVARLRVTLYIILGSPRGTDVFIEYQRSLGEEWSPHPTDEEVKREYDRVISLAESRKIEQLVDLPLITNRDVLDVLNVFAEVVMVASFTDANFYALLLCRMVGLSLEHGNSDASCFAYVSLGTVAGSRFGNYKAGFQLGKLGYDLVEKHGLHRYQARVYLRFGLCIMPWTRHVNTGRALIRRAFDAANRIGDHTFAAYSYNFLNTNLLAAGDPLAYVQREAESGLEFAQKARFLRVTDQITTQLALVRTLRGLTTSFGSFNEDHFDERQFETHLSSNSTLLVPECWYWIRKLQARFSAGDYTSAIEASLNAERLLAYCNYYFETAEHHFYSALARAGAFDSASQGSRQAHFKALNDSHRQLAIWAENCPENFENRAALVGAEIARIEGRDLDAMRLYEQAIRAARDHGFVQNEAVAYELAARFYNARGSETSANAHLGNARQCYLRWGADGKVRQLDRLYPHLRHESASPGYTDTIGLPVEQLDLATVIRVSQAVSGEIVLEKLIEGLMRTAVESAGAQRGVLLLSRGNRLRQEAEAITSGSGIIVRQPDEAVATLPDMIVQYVMRAREIVIVDDASAHPTYSMDSYVLERKARSILCLPLVNESRLIGVLYLENNLAPRVFTPNRTAILKLLTLQAVIALENTRLYGDLAQAEKALSASERDLKLIIDTMPALAWSARGDGAGEFFNQHYIDYVGLPLQQLQASGWQGVVYPEDLGGLWETWQTTTAAGRAGEAEARLRRADGEYRWFLFRWNPIHDDEGKIVKWYGVNTDIEDRKRVEIHLAGEKHVLEMMASGRALRDVLEALCQFFEGAAIDCFCGIYPIDGRGATFQYGVAPSLPASYTDPIEGLSLDSDDSPRGQSISEKIQVIAEDIGSDPRWAEAPCRAHVLEHGLRAVWSTPISSGEGTIIGTVCVYQKKPGNPSPYHQELIAHVARLASIAIERSQAEAARRLSEFYLTEGQRISVTGTFSWQVDTDELSFSEELNRMFEFEPNTDPTFDQLGARVHPDDLPLLAHNQALVRAGLDNPEYEIRLRMPDGRVKWMRVFARVSRRKDGRLECLGAVQDVTRRRLAEESRDKIRSELAHVSRVVSLGALTASIAHEVNQPLASIVTNGETGLRWLVRPEPNLAKVEDLIKRVVNDARRAAEIIDRTRTMAGRGSTKQSAIMLAEIITESAAFLQHEFQARGVSVSFDLAPDLPAVFGDRTQLQQVVVNLVVNAVQAPTMSEAAGKSIAIRTQKIDAETVCCIVEDSGLGIDAEHLPRLFDSFFTTKETGMGLGLPIAQSIIEAHNGRIVADNNSSLGGARFVFYLPVIRV
jgi:PAS domain S-box-containing protein